VSGRVVSVRVKGQVATLTLISGSDGQIAAQLCDAATSVSENESVRVVVVEGISEAFPADGLRPHVEPRKFASSLATVVKPVIAVINGDVINQALELMLACDICIASDESRFGLTNVSHGNMPSDGGTQRLPRAVGQARALEMLFTSRIVEAHEALRIGLVAEILPVSEVNTRVQELAAFISKLAPVAARYLKEAVLSGADMTLQQGLRLESDLGILLHSTRDRAEGVQSFEARRRPRFVGE